MISILFFIMDPPVLTSIAILLFGFVWADHLLPLLKADREQSLVKDERLKDLYYKYVYVATYFSFMANDPGLQKRERIRLCSPCFTFSYHNHTCRKSCQ